MRGSTLRSMALVLGVSLLLLLSPGFSQMAPAQMQSHSGDNLGNIWQDILHNGLRGQWAEYLRTQWEHKDKVVDAYFSHFDTLYIVLRKQVKSEEAALRQALEKSYEERVWNVDEGGAALSEHRLGLPNYVRLMVRYKG
ncbi:MAG: hypothetical protein HYY96_17700 [Candidatus Tectomicrobia bacterium]|nr:hypothetical protein [Candidatus Tectomicrobia bacterium]